MADNDGLIRKDIEHLGYTRPYPNISLEPEFDLVEEIYATHQRYNITASFQHVKGHQDWSKELSSLRLPAQLNVEADSLASAFYREGPLSTQNVIMTPSHQAKLTSIQGISITYAYTHQLIMAYMEPNYIKSLQDWF